MEIKGVIKASRPPPINKGVRFVPMELEFGLYPVLSFNTFPVGAGLKIFLPDN